MGAQIGIAGFASNVDQRHSKNSAPPCSSPMARATAESGIYPDTQLSGTDLARPKQRYARRFEERRLSNACLGRCNFCRACAVHNGDSLQESFRERPPGRSERRDKACIFRQSPPARCQRHVAPHSRGITGVRGPRDNATVRALFATQAQSSMGSGCTTPFLHNAAQTGEPKTSISLS